MSDVNLDSSNQRDGGSSQMHVVVESDGVAVVFPVSSNVGQDSSVW